MQSGLLLLVDADRRVQRGVTRVATELGLEVVACDTARAGVNAACALEPAAIVTELELPDMDGYWFVAQIRDQPTDVAACPIVVVTHEIDASSRARTLQAGADVFLQKPIAASDLVAQVKALVDMVQRIRDRRGALSWVGAPPKSVTPPADEAAPPKSVKPPAHEAAPPKSVKPPADEVAPPKSVKPPADEAAPSRSVKPPAHEAAPSRSVKPPADEAAVPRSRRGATRPPPDEAAAPRSRRGATRPPPVKAAGPSAPPSARASRPPSARASKPPKASVPARPPPVKVPPVRVPMFGSGAPSAPSSSGAPAPKPASVALRAAMSPLGTVPPAPRLVPAPSPPRPAPVASPPRPVVPRAPLLPRAPAPPRPPSGAPKVDPDDEDVIEAENDG